MSNYKATPKQWENIEGLAWGRNPLSNAACLLELRARVEALEAQANHSPGATKMVPPLPVATDEELKQVWLQGATLTQGNRAIYNLGVAHGQASSREVAEPAPVAGGLMERVKLAIDSALYDEDDHQWNEARAAILEVAKWLHEQDWKADVGEAVDLIEREAER
jgi:hypothetical protein